MRRSIPFVLLIGILSGPVAAQEGVNLLTNSGFEDGVFDPWVSYGDVTVEVVQELTLAAVPESPVEGDNALRVTVNSTPGNFWEAGLYQDYPFDAGKIYTFSAFLKTTQGTMTANFKPEQGCCNFPGFGEQQHTFGEEWTEFSVTTPVMEADIAEGRALFHIGFGEGTFWVDGVRFYEGEYVEPDFGPGDPKDRPCPIGGGAEIDPLSLDGDVNIIRWRLGDVEPDGVNITRNGEVLVEGADATEEQYVDEEVPPGHHFYELSFDVPGEDCAVVTTDVNSCISGLIASNREEGVRLSWENARIYDVIQIIRDGEEIDSIDGLEFEYVDEDAPLGLHTYEVVPDEGICVPATLAFEVEEPALPGENVLDNWGFEDKVLEPWNTYGAVTAEIVTTLDGAAVEEGPIEGNQALRIEMAEAGTNFWDAGLQQPYPFDQGKVYTLSVFVKSLEGERTINLKPERGCCGFAAIGEQQFTFGEEWTEISITTEPVAETIPEGQITFHVAFAAGVFFMDGVRFYEGEYVPPEFEEPPPPPPERPEFLRGDPDGSSTVNITDGIFLLNFLFLGGPGPACAEAGDVDNSGQINITDGIYVLNFLFLGGPDPFAPGSRECGSDPDEIGSPGDLGCETPPGDCVP